jgi:hypothetical protein
LVVVVVALRLLVALVEVGVVVEVAVVLAAQAAQVL